jgi:hypothetical protein
MKLAQHCLSAVPLAVAAYAATGGRFSAAIVAGLSSVLIDCDHVLDYLLYKKRWGGMQDFFAHCEEGRLPRLYLVLHSFELIIFLWLLVGFGTAAAWGVGLTIGMTGHLLMDWVGNRHIVKPSFYWFSFRAMHRFDGNELYQTPPVPLPDVAEDKARA